MLCSDLDLFPVDLEHVQYTSGVTWPKSIRNLSEIEQFPAELLAI